MSTSATVTLTDRATPELRRIAAQLKNPAALYKDVGRRAANELKRHYRDLDARRPNRLGAPRTHYWLEIRDAVQQPELVGNGVVVAINHSTIAGKVFGAVVTPKNARALTIPLHALAHGRRASTFEDETGKKLFRPKGKRVLMAEIGGKPVAIYALAKRVTLRPDPEALPEEGPFADALVATARAHLARRIAEAGLGTVFY
jgi:hypothetical protein